VLQLRISVAFAKHKTGFTLPLAIPAAVLPIFQPIFLILYLKMENSIKKFFKQGGKT